MIPKDPVMLLSFINLKLRDFYPSFEALCDDLDVDGKEIKMQVKEGQKVIYSKYAGTEVKVDGEELIIVRQSDILAVVE